MTPAADVSQHTTQLLNLAQHTIESAERRGRGDLVERIAARIALLDRKVHRVVICGSFKAGKSSLLNALVGSRIAPSSPTRPSRLTLSVIHGPSACGAYIDRGHEPSFVAVEANSIHELILGSATTLSDSRVLSAVVRLPAPVLAEGLVLVDTPPISGGLASPEAVNVLTELQRASAFVYVSDASQELTAPDVGFMAAALELCPTMLCCLTKKDAYPAWLRILQIDEQRLAELGVSVPVLPVSPAMYTTGVAASDHGLIRASGVGLLRRFLVQRVVGEGHRRSTLALSESVNAAAHDLSAAAKAEFVALHQPDELAQLEATAVEAKRKAKAFAGDEQRWKRVLQRELRSLADESSYALQVRLSELDDWAADELGNADPAQVWIDFEGQLQRETSQAIVDQLVFVRSAGKRAVERVAEALEEDADRLGLSLDEAAVPARAVEIDLNDDIFSGRLQLTQSGVVAARMGGAAGVTLWGALAATGVGAPIAVAVALGAALMSGSVFAIGGKRSSVESRRREAKIEVARYLKDARLAANKISTDEVARTQERIADEFDALGTRLTESAEERLRTYSRAKERSEHEVPQRTAELTAEAKQLEVVLQLSDHLLVGARS